MSWSEATVPAVRDGVRVPVRVRYREGDTAAVEVWLGPERRLATGEGPDLFEALVAARRGLEEEGLLLACNGCRRDVYPSAMQRQASHGRRAYVLTVPRTTTKPASVDIFEPAPHDADIATVAEQRSAFEEWMPSEPPGR